MSEEIKNKRNPYKNYSWLVYIALLVFALVIFKNLYQYNEYFDAIPFAIITLIGGFAGYYIVYILGKLIFGLIGKMKFISIHILFIKIYKENNKIKYALELSDSILGNVFMIPSTNDYNKVKPILYHFGGFISFMFVTVISVTVCYFIDPSAALYTSLVLAFIGLLVIFINLNPLYSDSLTDGFAIRLLLNKKNKKPYLDNLLQKNALIYSNGTLNGAYKYDEYNDIFQAESLLYLYYYYMNQNDTFLAEKVLDKMIDNKDFLSLENVQLAYCNKMYFMLQKESNEYCYDYFYSLNKEYRKFSITKGNLEAVKTGLLLSAKVEKSYELYDYLLRSYKKSIDKYYSSRRKYEIALIEKSIKQVEEMFPEWKNEE